MLGLLKRHEVEILLKAGHRRTEVARLTGISPGSVRRIAGEASIEHFNCESSTETTRPYISRGMRPRGTFLKS
jgi:DNA invertase Pin-like site-specific DNA recombinase